MGFNLFLIKWMNIFYKVLLYDSLNWPTNSWNFQVLKFSFHYQKLSSVSNRAAKSAGGVVAGPVTCSRSQLSKQWTWPITVCMCSVSLSWGAWEVPNLFTQWREMSPHPLISIHYQPHVFFFPSRCNKHTKPKKKKKWCSWSVKDCPKVPIMLGAVAKLENEKKTIFFLPYTKQCSTLF